MIAFVPQRALNTSLSNSQFGVQWLNYPELPFSGPVQFEARSLLEQDETKRQLVVYSVIMDSEGRVMIYQRPDKQDETRLSNRFSIGIGGHVNFGDIDREPTTPDAIWALIAAASKRELREELQFTTDATPQIVIAATVSQVDRVHLGFVSISRVTDETASQLVMARESGTIIGWQLPRDMRSVIEGAGGELESWSKRRGSALGIINVEELPSGSIIKKDG